MCRQCHCNHDHDEDDRCCGRPNPCHNENDPFEEVERIARRVRNRRCREDRCARQFCRCMRAVEFEGNRPEGCGRNNR